MSKVFSFCFFGIDRRLPRYARNDDVEDCRAVFAMTVGEIAALRSQ